MKLNADFEQVRNVPQPVSSEHDTSRGRRF
jgi:hypothetical protein